MTEQGLRAPAPAHPAAAQLVPGYLLTPFGWAAQSLTALLAAEPGLLPNWYCASSPQLGRAATDSRIERYGISQRHPRELGRELINPD
jgi:hypothetical protein